MKPIRSITPSEKYAEKKEDEGYRRTHQKVRGYSAQSVLRLPTRRRARMMRKIENEKNKRAKAANEKNLAKSSPGLLSMSW